MPTYQHKLISIALITNLALSTVPFVYATKEDSNGKSEEAHERNEERKAAQNDTQGNPHSENPIIFIEQSGPDSGDNQHPSGKDRSQEHGNSKEQGKSQSDPDGDENANGGQSGKDKIGFDGGFDKADQDGNNGCGNDDDFEDDNKGNCGGKLKKEKPNIGSPITATPTVTPTPTSQPTATPTPKPSTTTTPTPTPIQSVLGTSTDNKGNTLPWTGDFLGRLGIMLTVAGLYAMFFGILPMLKRKAYEFAFPKSNKRFYKHGFLI